MEVRIKFRFNKLTGEVETFTVEDEQTTPPLDHAEHNRRHDQIASEIGRQIERNPHIEEFVDGAAPVIHTPTPEPSNTTSTPNSIRRQ